MIWLKSLFQLIADTFNAKYRQDAELTAFKLTALKGLGIFLTVTVLPIVLYNVYFLILFTLINFSASYIQEQQIPKIVLNFTGIGAWILQKMKFTECLTIYINCITIKFALSFLRK